MTTVYEQAKQLSDAYAQSRPLRGFEVRSASSETLASWLIDAAQREARYAQAGTPAPQFAALTLERVRDELVRRAG